ncbi:MAG: AAA family ATPase [Candidatus Methanomethylicaceae archaeon]
MTLRSPKVNIIKNTDDEGPLYYKGLHYGHTRAGKTYLAATSAAVEALSPVLLVDCGNSRDTVMGEDFGSPIDVVVVSSVDELNDVFSWLSDGAYQQYGMIIVDELDSLYEILMRDRLDHAVKEYRSKGEQRDPNRAYLEDYGIVYTQMNFAVRLLIDLKTNIIVTSWAERDKDPITGIEKLYPSLPGKLANVVPAKFGVVCYQTAEGARTLRKDLAERGEYIAHFRTTGAFIAGVRGKTRAERVGESITNPTMAEIYKRWKGE